MTGQSISSERSFAKRVRFGLPVLLLLGGALMVLKGASDLEARPVPPSGGASLIYCGWFGNTIPTPSFVSSNIDFLETQPFDGLVVYLRNPNLTVNVTTGVMTNTPMSYAAMSGVMAPLIGLPYSNLTENLGLVQGSTPPDFFNSWTVPIQNFANVAAAARDAGLKGICFDNEQYFSPWGNYPTGVAYPGYTLAQYETQARLRGKQVMEAMVAQFPGIVVMTLHGPYVSEPDAPASLGFPQWQSSNELLGPFFSGMMEGVAPETCNMDGGELYTLRTATQFQNSADWRRNTLPSASVNCSFIPPALRPLWPGLSSISFGVYDTAFGGAPMNPAILETTLVNALETADRYVWFYSEAATYLLPPSQGGASAAWVDAIRQAKLQAGGSPPSAPTNLGASPASSSAVNLTWIDTSTDEDNFEVERKTGPAGTWGTVLSPAANMTAAQNGGLSPSTTYFYRIRAVNGEGSSPWSNEAAVTTLTAPSGPAAPSNLVVTPASSSQLNLVWGDNSPNETGFEIQRKQGAGTWGYLATTGVSINGFWNLSLPAQTTYSYRVKAINGQGSSAWSNEVAATTLPGAQPPAAPSGLAATVISSSQINLVWNDNSNNETGFQVQRRTGLNGTWTLVATTGVSINGFWNTGLSANTTYYYRVRAVNAAGSSAWSNTVNKKTLSN